MFWTFSVDKKMIAHMLETFQGEAFVQSDNPVGEWHNYMTNH